MDDPDAAYRSTWETFTHLAHTEDALAKARRGWRRWLLRPYIGFIIPVDDPAVIDQACAWQDALRPWLPYDPLPLDQLHITLHYVGGLADWRWAWLPHTWRRSRLPCLTERVRTALNGAQPFEVAIGPLNAFDAVLFAETHDNGNCLRRLRTTLRRALPLRARPPTRLAFVPHMTLGYWGTQPVAPLLDALRPFRSAPPVSFCVTRVKFTAYTSTVEPLARDILRRAREDVVAEITLGSQ